MENVDRVRVINKSFIISGIIDAAKHSATANCTKISLNYSYQSTDKYHSIYTLTYKNSNKLIPDKSMSIIFPQRISFAY